ncbi:HAD family hydrolase, partial [Escherichia coli]|uniref:HAD family hydrolase n=1 Tax=Escherichia coli TaxID=562 RepID=UPI00227F3BA7
AELDAPMRAQAERGVTPVLLAVDGKPAALFAIRDPLREDSVAALQRLHQQGYQLVMLTGDNPVITCKICRDVGLEPGEPLSGLQIEQMDDEELAREVEQRTVFT